MNKILLSLFVFGSLSTYAQVQPPSWNSVGSPGFSAGNALATVMAIDKAGTPYIAYQDGIDGPATVMKFYNGRWVSVGNPGFSAGTAKYVSLAISGDGTPYVAYMDAAKNDSATVMRYDGEQWVAVTTPVHTLPPISSPSCSPAQVQCIAIAIDRTGMPYIAFQDADSSKFKTTVMRYESGKWVITGNQFFSAAVPQYISIAIDGRGMPYVAYEDGPSGPATVMKYNGSSWMAVGDPGFSAGRAKYTSIAVDRYGTPFVAYLDAGNASKATVMAYVDTSWVTIGKAGFTPGQVYYISLALDSIGIPYVAYSDNSDSNKATVMRYNPYTTGAWEVVGATGFSSAWAWSTTIAIDGSGIPYVVYSDLGYDYKATVMKLEPVATGIKNTVKTDAVSLSIFPNPNHGSFTLNISATQKENAIITITSVLGEKVKELTTTTNAATQIQIDGPPGIYFISAVTNKERITGRVVIE